MTAVPYPMLFGLSNGELRMVVSLEHTGIFGTFKPQVGSEPIAPPETRVNLTHTGEEDTSGY